MRFRAMLPLASTTNMTRAPAFRAILLALMSVFSTKTFLALSRSFSLRSFWYGAAALSVASTANLLTGPFGSIGFMYRPLSSENIMFFALPAFPRRLCAC
uniref:CHLD n=1 Tax=Arundo donax TaxID=35708 RepID=A0A0A9DYP3_ARUDO